MQNLLTPSLRQKHAGSIVISLQVCYIYSEKILRENIPRDHYSQYWGLATTSLETMSLREMGPQLKLPINVMKGSMPLQCSTYFPQIFAI